MKYLLFLGVIAVLIGCSQEEFSSVPNYQISFSEELSLDFGEVGMSSEVSFSISPLDEKNESFLVFNTFYRRLDTVLFSPEKKRVVPGLEVPKEGPGSVPGFSSFSYTEQGILFFTANEFYYFKDGETIKMKISKVLGDDGKSLKSIQGYDLINGTFQPAPYKGDFIGMIIKDSETKKYTLMKFDFESFKEIPFSFDTEQLARNRISFNYLKGVMLSNAYDPYLTFSDSVLIVSYPFMNKISTVKLEDLRQNDFFPKSRLVKSQRDKPIESSEIKSFEEYYEASSNWHNDVKFGSIQRLNSRMLYRLVGGGKEGYNKLVLELFNNEFDKVGEFNLKDIYSDLKGLHITVEGKILIQSSKDPDEDLFKYYLVSVDPIGFNNVVK